MCEGDAFTNLCKSMPIYFTIAIVIMICYFGMLILL